MTWQSTVLDTTPTGHGWVQIKTRRHVVLWVNHSYALVYMPGITPMSI